MKMLQALEKVLIVSRQRGSQVELVDMTGRLFVQSLESLNERLESVHQSVLPSIQRLSRDALVALRAKRADIIGKRRSLSSKGVKKVKG